MFYWIHCLWEVPVSGELVDSWVTLCCGINDNPKLPKDSGGTFCGQLWDTCLVEQGIPGADLWGKAPAMIYGIQSYFQLYPNMMAKMVLEVYKALILPCG
jgi:hypothetical protein